MIVSDSFKIMPDYCIVKPFTDNEEGLERTDDGNYKTESGLYMSKEAIEKQQKETQKGMVLAVGSDFGDQVVPYDIVTYGRYTPRELHIDNTYYHVLSNDDKDIIAVIGRYEKPEENE